MILLARVRTPPMRAGGGTARREPVMGAFTLQEHDITVAEVHQEPPTWGAVRTRHQVREGCQRCRQRGARRLLRGEDRPLAQGQAGRQAPRVRGEHLVGPGQHPARADALRHQPRARPRLPEHARPPLLHRRLRRLGPQVPDQDPRHLLAAVSRALHAHDADPADEGRTGEPSASRTSPSTTRGPFPQTSSPPASGRGPRST